MEDFVSGQSVENTPEERSIQILSRWLHQLGYGKHQIQTRPQYRIKDRVGGKNRSCPLDLVVFRGEERVDEDILIVAECKKYRGNGGLDQLHGYLNRCGASVGIWFNGADLTFVLHVFGAAEHMSVPCPNPDPRVTFGPYLRNLREQLLETDNKFSVRKTAKRIGIQPNYLSKIERSDAAPPSEEVLEKLAQDLDVHPAKMAAMAGKITSKMRSAILMRPDVMIPLLHALEDAPKEVLEKVVRTVRDGKW